MLEVIPLSWEDALKWILENEGEDILAEFLDDRDKGG